MSGFCCLSHWPLWASRAGEMSMSRAPCDQHQKLDVCRPLQGVLCLVVNG